MSRDIYICSVIWKRKLEKHTLGFPRLGEVCFNSLSGSNAEIRQSELGTIKIHLRVPGIPPASAFHNLGIKTMLSGSWHCFAAFVLESLCLLSWKSGCQPPQLSNLRRIQSNSSILSRRHSTLPQTSSKSTPPYILSLPPNFCWDKRLCTRRPNTKSWPKNPPKALEPFESLQTSLLYCVNNGAPGPLICDRSFTLINSNPLSTYSSLLLQFVSVLD